MMFLELEVSVMSKRVLISIFLLAHLFVSSVQARYFEAAKAGDTYHLNPSAMPFQTITFKAVSRGANAAEFPFQLGVARFFKNGVKFYERIGGGGGGRGFNIAAINPITGDLIGSVQNFDTWGSRTTGEAMNAMITFLNSLPDGTLVMIAVADEAGLNGFDSCDRLNFPWVENGLQALEELGSSRIRDYCYRNSYAMVCFKGEGHAREEQLTNAVEASAQTALDIIPPCPIVSSINPTSGQVGTSVTITGTNFTGVSAVRFANNVSAAFTINSASQITATVPVGAVTGPINITKSGCADIQTGTFTVLTFIPKAGLFGINFSPYRDGQDPNSGSQIKKKQLKQRMRIVRPFTEWIATFGTSGGLDKAGKIAHQLGLKIAVGAWLSGDLDANEREILTLIRIAQSGQADIVIVSTEVLLRGDLSADQLIGYISRVKQAVPGIPVTTREVYGILLSHPDLVAAVDVVFANIYSYWEGIRVDNAIAFLSNKYNQLVAASEGRTVFISETGWPSCGNQVGQAVPSPENASFYFNGFTTWARTNNVPYFYFEAFDESWKAKYEGPQGACWGIWDKDGNLKPGMLVR
jgi:exo-beta-1,3-glucanase (GH17 family)